MIQKQYPGGVEAFKENNGMVVMVPDPVEEIIVLLPSNTPEELRTNLKSIKKCTVLASKPYIDSESLLTKIKANIRVHPHYIAVNSGIVTMVFTMVTVEDPKVKSIIEKVKKIPGLEILYVMGSDNKIIRIQNEVEDVYEMKAKMERTTSISEDDILNLKISLETKDVDAFIKSI
jgi:hypothetical protein